MPEAHGWRDKVLEKAMESLFTLGAIRVGDVWDSLQRKRHEGIIAVPESGDAGEHPDEAQPNDVVHDT